MNMNKKGKGYGKVVYINYKLYRKCVYYLNINIYRSKIYYIILSILQGLVRTVDIKLPEKRFESYNVTAID